MLKIFICDDNKVHLNLVKDSVTTGLLFSEIGMTLQLATTNPQTLLTEITVEEGAENVYFLDIDYEGETTNGLQLAMAIREIDPFGFIIFITSHVEFGFLTFEYQLGVFDYIIKPADPALLKEKILSSLRTIEKRLLIKAKNQLKEGESATTFRFVSDYEEKFVLVEQILMIETVGNHKLKVTTTSQLFECNGSLGQLEQELPTYFFRTHRSYLVNLKEVVQKNKASDDFLLSNGAKFDCSRKNRKKFYDLLTNQ